MGQYFILSLSCCNFSHCHGIGPKGTFHFMWRVKSLHFHIPNRSFPLSMGQQGSAILHRLTLDSRHILFPPTTAQHRIEFIKPYFETFSPWSFGRYLGFPSSRGVYQAGGSLSPITSAWLPMPAGHSPKYHGQAHFITFSSAMWQKFWDLMNKIHGRMWVVGPKKEEHTQCTLLIPVAPT